MPQRSKSRSQPEAFPVLRVADIALQPDKPKWLVDSLWAASGVGIVGGLPKCLKTWLATELAVAVASGHKALGRFEVHVSGPVLVFAAEDDLAQMRARFLSVASARGVCFQSLPVFLINAGSLYLDDLDQLSRLRQTIQELSPRLLVLDPFVRIARVDENSAQEVSAILGALRALQREHDLAVLLVHHLRKSPTSHLGQQLRGSGDFAAWYDSGLYLVRHDGGLWLHAEHRTAPAPPPLRLQLHPGDCPHLVVLDDHPGSPSCQPPSSAPPLLHALLERLRSVPRPHSTVELRDFVHARKASVLEALRLLQAKGLVVRDGGSGWRIAPPSPDDLSSQPHQQQLALQPRAPQGASS